MIQYNVTSNIECFQRVGFVFSSAFVFFFIAAFFFLRFSLVFVVSFVLFILVFIAALSVAFLLPSIRKCTHDSTLLSYTHRSYFVSFLVVCLLLFLLSCVLLFVSLFPALIPSISAYSIFILLFRFVLCFFSFVACLLLRLPFLRILFICYFCSASFYTLFKQIIPIMYSKRYTHFGLVASMKNVVALVRYWLGSYTVCVCVKCMYDTNQKSFALRFLLIGAVDAVAAYSHSRSSSSSFYPQFFSLCVFGCWLFFSSFHFIIIYDDLVRAFPFSVSV